MNQGKYVFAQLLTFLPKRSFDGIVNKYNGNKYVHHFIDGNLAQMRLHYIRITKSPSIPLEIGGLLVISCFYKGITHILEE